MNFLELVYTSHDLSGDEQHILTSSDGRLVSFERNFLYFSSRHAIDLEETLLKQFDVTCTALVTSRSDDVFWYSLYFPMNDGIFIYEVEVDVEEKVVESLCQKADKTNQEFEFAPSTTFPYPAEVFTGMKTTVKEYIEQDPDLRLYFTTGELPTDKWRENK